MNGNIQRVDPIGDREATPIESAQSRLQDNLSTTGHLLGRLEERLSSVLRSPLPETASAPKAVGHAPESPLHSDLLDRINAVDHININIESILRRLTV